MAMQASFEQILRKKLSGENPLKTAAPASPEPANLAYMLGQIPVFRFQTNARPKMANQTKQAKTTSEQVQQKNDAIETAQVQPQQEPFVAPVRASTQPHVLNERQKLAMLFFEQNNEPLLPDFTKEELKKAYRKLARKLHPDATKSADATPFIELKAQAKQLSELGE